MEPADAHYRPSLVGTSASIAVRARQLSKIYGTRETRVHALRSVSVDIERGRFTAIMGPSGSGKSTLMHCLAALEPATSGQIWIGRSKITRLNERQLTRLRRDKIGFIFQAYNLIPTLTAVENITLPMDIARRQADPKWLKSVIDTVGLADRLRHRPSQLSGGQQQRVAVARALTSRPDIIFGDEPTGNLDSHAGSRVLSLLRNSVDDLGQTVVLVTHDPTAASYADRVLFMADGSIVDEALTPTTDTIVKCMLHLARGDQRPAVPPARASQGDA
ncbi:ABC transporter ATP-binding protein [Streptomyces sp. NPDC056254]|uniref:ABC transporter ATP-binding protein n=1 Tax=Streptomyces sp. NPDC056254 TaxID=3345763 RepID=UPI0035D5531B